MNHAYHTLAVELAVQHNRLKGFQQAKDEAERRYQSHLQIVSELESAIVSLGHTVDEVLAYGEGENY
jgi:hypothetical protein